MLRALTMLCGVILGACGAPPPPAPVARLDVLQQVYLRGNSTQFVALSFEGIGPCTAALLARMKEPGEGLAPLRATFFVDVETLPDKWAEVLPRLESEGHELALSIAAVPSDWATAPEAFRRGLTARFKTLQTRLTEAGWGGGLPRFWRPGGAPDPFTLGRTADAERPVILWTLHGEGGTAEAMARRILPRLQAGQVLALPGGGAGCPVVELVPALARALAVAKWTAVPVGQLLAPELLSHHPPQAVRYRGPGLPVGCAAGLGRAVEPDAEVVRPRWGLVGELVGDAVRVLPLAGANSSTAELLEGAAVAQWAARARWAAMPGCLRRVPMRHLLSPIAGGAGGARVPQWWSSGEEGIAPRDARAAGAPGRAAVLPALSDLARLEASQRLPWNLRGLVADALTRLSLQTPLLIEARAVPAVLIGRPLEPSAPPEEVEAALGAFTQVVELSMAEYQFLAMNTPSELARLLQAAHAADGFLRAGPFVVLRSAGLPDGRSVGPNEVGFVEGPAAAVQRVLAAGHRLDPGDVVTGAAVPLLGAPQVVLSDEKLSRRNRLRLGLARSILRGSHRSAYLRPGAVLHVGGDLLGEQVVRIAVPAGVAVPSLDAGPFRPVLPGATVVP